MIFIAACHPIELLAEKLDILRLDLPRHLYSYCSLHLMLIFLKKIYQNFLFCVGKI